MIPTMHLAGILLLAASTVQSPADVSGAWEVRFASSVRRHTDGTLEVLAWGTGRLALEQDGGRLWGTWSPAVGRTILWKLEGTVDGNSLRLHTTELDAPAEVREELAILKSVHWEGTIDGSSIQGRMWRELEGAVRGPMRLEWSANRVP